MSPIFEGALPMLSEGRDQPIGIRLTDLQSGSGCGCLSRVALLHTGHQVSPCGTLLFFVHLFPHAERIGGSFLALDIRILKDRWKRRVTSKPSAS